MSDKVVIKFRPDGDGPLVALVDGALVRGFEDGAAEGRGEMLRPGGLRAPHRKLPEGVTPGALAVVTLDDEPSRVVFVEDVDAARVQLRTGDDGPWSEIPIEAVAALPHPRDY